ncbi:MAG: D-alanine--D-alanine ligase [Armatimonadota bacterium]
MRKLRVTVLTGGTSAERDVCLMSGRKVVGALDPARYEVRCVDLAAVNGRGAAACLMGESSRELEAVLEEPAAISQATAGAELPETADASRATAIEPAAGREGLPDVAFIALHGGTGENGSVQGMLELLGIPYTGSGVLASALAMNKIMAKRIFEHQGIPTPRWLATSRQQQNGVVGSVVKELGLPCVIKPACEGSTIGVTVARQEAEIGPGLETAFSYGAEVLVEEFIEGTEITGPVLGNDEAQVLPLVEIVPGGGFYDYRAKYTPGATEEVCPARLSAATAARARELTLRAHHALGCRGISRVDMIATPEEVYVLEVNTIPGLTDTSLVPRSAEVAGISFDRLIERLIELALEGRGGDCGGRRS